MIFLTPFRMTTAYSQGFLTRNVSLDLVFFQYILNLENFVIKYF